MEQRTLPACPVENTLMLSSGKWKVPVLRDLMPGARRFGALRSVGDASQKALTALGGSPKPILDAMRGWGEAYKAGTL